MSSIAAWSYKNTATIRPYVSTDTWSGEVTYGAEYEIACNWTAVDEQERGVGGQGGAGGAELVRKHIVYTEDVRPKVLDLILLNDQDVWEEIRDKTGWDMAMFADTMDFKLVTG